MTRPWLAFTSLLLIACASPLRTSSLTEELTAGKALAIALPSPETTSPMTLPGDYAVYRLTGSYRPEGVTITQRVRSRQHGLLVLDMSIEDAQGTEQLRLRIDDGARRGEVLSVGRLREGKLEPYGVVAYEARMTDLVPAAEVNEGEIARTGEIVTVGTSPVFCVRTDYRVRMGTQRGTMSTLGVSGFPGENLGGKIVTDDGSVIYHAQLVELGNQQPNTMPSGRALAASPSDLYEEIDE